MVAKGDPKKIQGIKDLGRPHRRFINRQSGSGTRLLLDLLQRKEGVAPLRLHGDEQCELTHAAVAADVASGLADVPELVGAQEQGADDARLTRPPQNCGSTPRGSGG